jgi:hypothetical protein
LVSNPTKNPVEPGIFFIMATYTKSQREEAVKSRLQGIIDGPRPDYPEPRRTGYLISKINGRKVVVLLEPYKRNITQWRVTIDGKLFSEHCGMSQVYEELARLNPPARNY